MWWQTDGGKKLVIHLQQLSETLQQSLPGSSGEREPACLVSCLLSRWNCKSSDLLPVGHADISFPLWVSLPRVLISPAGMMVKYLLVNIQIEFAVQEFAFPPRFGLLNYIIVYKMLWIYLEGRSSWNAAHCPDNANWHGWARAGGPNLLCKGDALQKMGSLLRGEQVASVG